MSRIVVIGGSGHVGSYLMPMLVELGHDVINVSRGALNPYHQHHAWSHIKNVRIDRRKEEKDGNFGHLIANLEADIVVDMISFDLASTQQIVKALYGRVEHYLFCSSIWVYGRYTSIPSIESDPVSPIDDYGRGKAESEAWLMRQARREGFPATCFRPGHIVGKGWVPTTPQGNSDPNVFSRIIKGEEIALPNLGHETLHHVHAADVARWIILAIENRQASIGEIFNVVSSQAITLRGYAEQVYRWFDRTPNISFHPFNEWLEGLDKEYAENSKGHIVRSSVHSIEKSQLRLGYQPYYTSLDAIHESVMSLIDAGIIAKS
ncbi:NAD-dependent epimerase/dehydratase family protein [Zymobacter sp. IVIA_12111.31 C1]|uniref:NAD-dependent epimerase/dehydratase family protein n=1 Tax=Zymobacter sp. IVIA_12111.31 C1 TaxID=3394854 RepID=UPI0039C3170D